MKKYLLGVFAIALAVGFSSFSAKFSKTFNYTLQTYQDSDVRTLSNWSLGSVECFSGDVKACQIIVPDAYVNGSNQLQNLTIESTTGSTSKVTALKDAGNPITGASFENKD